MKRREQRRYIGPNIEHSEWPHSDRRSETEPLSPLSPEPGGLNTSSPPHNTTLLASKFIIFHFNIFPCGALCVQLRMKLLLFVRALGGTGAGNSIILLTVIFDVRRNVTSFKTSNFEYFTIFENKILII